MISPCHHPVLFLCQAPRWSLFHTHVTFLTCLSLSKSVDSSLPPLPPALPPCAWLPHASHTPLGSQFLPAKLHGLAEANQRT